MNTNLSLLSETFDLIHDLASNEMYSKSFKSISIFINNNPIFLFSDIKPFFDSLLVDLLTYFINELTIKNVSINIIADLINNNNATETIQKIQLIIDSIQILFTIYNNIKNKEKHDPVLLKRLITNFCKINNQNPNIECLNYTLSVFKEKPKPQKINLESTQYKCYVSKTEYIDLKKDNNTIDRHYYSDNIKILINDLFKTKILTKQHYNILTNSGYEQLLNWINFTNINITAIRENNNNISKKNWRTSPQSNQVPLKTLIQQLNENIKNLNNLAKNYFPAIINDALNDNDALTKLNDNDKQIYKDKFKQLLLLGTLDDFVELTETEYYDYNNNKFNC